MCNVRSVWIRLKCVLDARLQESASQMRALRQGINDIVPLPLFALFTAQELEHLVCGQPDVDVEALKRTCIYDAPLTEQSQSVVYFWNAMRDFNGSERTQFMSFVSGPTPPQAFDFCV